MAFKGGVVLGTVNLNNSGSGVTTIGTGGTGVVNIGNATGNTTVTGTLTATATTGTISSIVTAPSTTGAAIIATNTSSDTNSCRINIRKSRAGGAITSGDSLGNVQFSGNDGTNYIVTSQIRAVNSGTVAANRVASNLEFWTSPDSVAGPAQRVVVASTGAMTINSPDSGTGLTISGGGITSTGATSFSGGTATINTGTSAISISTDASATTVNIATGAAAKVTTLGSTNGASSLALQYGTADFSLASATGNVMVAQDTGEINYPLQSAFLAIEASTVSDVTGDGTAYTVVWDTEIFDQNADFSSTTFTAPVTGRYRFELGILVGGLTSSHTAGNYQITCSNRNFLSNQVSFFAAATSGAQFSNSITVLADMDAADTCVAKVTVSNGTKVVDVVSAGATDPRNWFSGNLVC